MNTINFKKVIIPLHQNCKWELVNITPQTSSPLLGDHFDSAQKVRQSLPVVHKKLTISGPLGVQSMIIPNIISVEGPLGGAMPHILISTTQTSTLSPFSSNGGHRRSIKGPVGGKNS